MLKWLPGVKLTQEIWNLLGKLEYSGLWRSYIGVFIAVMNAFAPGTALFMAQTNTQFRLFWVVPHIAYVNFLINVLSIVLAVVSAAGTILGYAYVSKQGQDRFYIQEPGVT